MSRTMKIVLGIGILALVVCGLIVALGGWAGMKFLQGMKTDPAEVAEVAHSMVDYTLPAGMKEVLSMEIMGMKAVVFSTSGLEPGSVQAGMSIMMMQMPVGATGADTSQLQDAMKRQLGGQQGQLAPVGEKTVDVNGQPVTFRISESTSSKGAMRQMVGLVAGKADKVMVLIQGPVAGWDDAATDSFLASIH